MNTHSYKLPETINWMTRPRNIHKMFMFIYILAPILTFLVMYFKSRASLDGALFLSIFFIPAFIHYLAMVGLRNGKEWGRVLSVVIAIFLLFLFPVGTIAGVIIMYKLFRPNWRAVA